MSSNPEPPPPTNPTPPAPPKRKRRRWLRLILATVVIASIVLGAITAYLVNMDLPDVRALEDYQPPTITQLLADDNRVVHQFAEQKRIVVPLSKMNPMLPKAVIAVEDANFLKHVGVDPTALFRAAVRDVLERRWAQGGSTLTQQLAKILFLRPDKRLRRKIQEAILAIQIEKTYTKDEILQIYLNQIYMGHGRYGMEAAAQFYFGCSSADLTLDQAALLAGVIQRPEAYSPIRSPERAAQRRNHVLDRMAIESFITREEAERAKQVTVTAHQSMESDLPAPYFAEEIRKILSARYGDETLMRGGLSVVTGLDLTLQKAATTALSKGLRDLDKRRGFRRPARNIVMQKLGTLETYMEPSWERHLQPGDLVFGLVMDVSPGSAEIRIGKRTTTILPRDASWTGRDDLRRLLRPGDLPLFEVVSDDGARLSLSLDQEPEVEGAVLALDPRTGDIKAMVGGFDFGRSQFNRTFQAQRQCGSAFKPFIYGAAIEAGRTPSDLLFDEPTVFLDPTGGAIYQPENYERRYEGVVTLRKALEESLNIPTIRLLNEIGYQNTVAFANRLGITAKLYPYPSLGLGSSEVSLMELTAAYGVFATGGILSTPRYFSQVKDRDGNVLEETAGESREVLRSDVAAVMTSMMQGVLTRGTAASATRPGVALAGKTGTTDDYTDAWFIGFSPSVVIGVWVGHDKKITLGPKETGAKAALPIWSAVMDEWLRSHPSEAFPVSPDVVTVLVDRDTGLRAAPETGCRTEIMETFVKGTEVERPCHGVAHQRLTLPYYLQRYAAHEDGQLDIPDNEVDRLLRENPSTLDLVGRTSLNVLTPMGPRLVRLARGSGGGSRGRDVTWGFFRHQQAPEPEGEKLSDLTAAEFLPSGMPALDTQGRGFVGIDGRSAAAIPIKYP